ncbi:MAG: hypothetical protein ABII22_03960 [Candidatus Micrarchaeota archaeon]
MSNKGQVTFELMIGIVLTIAVIGAITISLNNFKDGISIYSKTAKERIELEKNMLVLDQKMMSKGYNSLEIGGFSIKGNKLAKTSEGRSIEYENVLEVEFPDEEST